LIPNSGTDSFISTNPKTHVELSTKKNTSHSGMLVPIEKMIKGWNRTIDNHFRSFHLEVLVRDPAFLKHRHRFTKQAKLTHRSNSAISRPCKMHSHSWWT